MPRSPRAEALHTLRSDQHISPPAMPTDIQPTSPEAAEHLDSTKAMHYVVFARLIDRLFDQALNDRQPDQRELTMKPYHQGDRWYALADSWHKELLEAQISAGVADLHNMASAFAKVKGVLQPGTHIDVDTQLMAGATTGVSTVLSLIRNLPRIIRHHTQPEEVVDPLLVARHPRSTELTRRQAKLSVNQMLAAQAVLASAKQRTNWTHVNQVLDPGHFKLHRYPNGEHSLGYEDLVSLKVPAGYHVRDLKTVDRPTPVSELPSFQSVVVGCPVTLLEKRLGQLWHWGIDLVEANGLWDETWPKTPVTPEPSPSN